MLQMCDGGAPPSRVTLQWPNEAPIGPSSARRMAMRERRAFPALRRSCGLALPRKGLADPALVARDRESLAQLNVAAFAHNRPTMAFQGITIKYPGRPRAPSRK